MKPVIPSSQHVAPLRVERLWKSLPSAMALWTPLKARPPQTLWQAGRCRPAGFFFFKKLLNSHTVDVESVSCLVLKLHEAECAHLDFSFARMRRIVDRSNLRGTTTSHWGQSRGAVPLGSREETEAVRCQARAVTPLAGVTSPPGTHVWLTVAVWR